MSTLSLIQVGDVHLPEFKSERAVDFKDDGISDEMLAILAPPKLQTIVRAITRLQAELKDPCLLFCGDLSNFGSTTEYKKCVDFLVDALDLSARNPDMIHVVPGNHDIDRNLCTSKIELNLAAKFTPLTDAWTSAGVDVLSVEGIRESRIIDSMDETRVYSLNSCIGCGEWRAMPTKIQDDFGRVIKEFTTSVTAEEAFELAGEQLDTPMIRSEDLESLNENLKALPREVLPIVLAHHNILPQARLRVDLYTELINSGPFRTTLTQHSRPIIYCHGHVHSDPIEIVSDGTRPLSRIIAVSAPVLVDGFNVLHVHFSREHLPIGLVVDFYRLQSGGGVSLAHSHRIPFCHQTPSALTDPDLKRLAAVLNVNQEMRFDAIRIAFNENRNVSANRKTMREILLEAEWRGLLTIDDRDYAPEQWVIRRKYQ